MQSIDNIILRNTNPFDDVYCPQYTNNDDFEPTIGYIHQEIFLKIEALLGQILLDYVTRSVLITGNSGCGKTYLLTRLKSQLSYKTCFVQIPPFAKRDSIWRRILRYTVDNLVKNTDDNHPSHLLLWLSSIKEEKETASLFGFLRTEKQSFINKLKEKYKQVKIYNPDNFFAVLYDLLNPELYQLACRYLRGEDLTEESLKTLGVEQSIYTETTAKETLINLSRISCDIQTIILCFNQIESIAQLPDGSLDVDTLFQINTQIKEDTNNIVTIISLASHRWLEAKDKIQASDRASINQIIELKDISLAQAELFLGYRLESLHKQAYPQPEYPIYPLNRQQLEQIFPTGKVNFRDIVVYARNAFQSYKEWIAKDNKKGTFTFYKKTQDKLEILSYFKVRWYEELAQIQAKIKCISQLSATELTQFLQETLLALQLDEVTTPLLIRTKYASYSLSYKLPNQAKTQGVIWTEDENLTSFFYVMEACRKRLEKDKFLQLTLIRSQSLGEPQSKGYQVYQNLFANSTQNSYITPDLKSVHYLATYHSLVRNAREGDLVITNKVISLKNLQSLMAATQIFYDCSLLQNLGIISNRDAHSNTNNAQELDIFQPMQTNTEWKDAKDYIFNFVITQSCLSRKILLQKAGNNFPNLTELQLDGLVQQLCWENKIKIIDAKASPEYQLVCLFPRKDLSIK
jgi:hypothetical protein